MLSSDGWGFDSFSWFTKNWRAIVRIFSCCCWLCFEAMSCSNKTSLICAYLFCCSWNSASFFEHDSNFLMTVLKICRNSWTCLDIIWTFSWSESVFTMGWDWALLSNLLSEENRSDVLVPPTSSYTISEAIEFYDSTNLTYLTLAYFGETYFSNTTTVSEFLSLSGSSFSNIGESSFYVKCCLPLRQSRGIQSI